MNRKERPPRDGLSKIAVTFRNPVTPSYFLNGVCGLADDIEYQRGVSGQVSREARDANRFHPDASVCDFDV